MWTDLREAARSLPACIAAACAVSWVMTDSAGVGLVLGTIAAGARVGFGASLILGMAGLLLGGFVGPVVWAPENWLLLLVAGLLGGAEEIPSRHRWLATLAVLIGVAFVVDPGRIWAGGIFVGMLAGRLALPERSERLVLGGLALATVAGLALSVQHGFVRVGNPSSRALLVVLGETESLIAPGQEDAFWSWGRTAHFRAEPGGLTFDVVPSGRTLPFEGHTATDRAEVGQLDCDALMSEALAGGPRSRVQAVACDPLESLALDPYVDAARVLAGHAPQDAATIHALELPEDLDGPGAVVLAARAELDNPRPAALRLVEGSPYDRAVLLAELGPVGIQSVEDLVATWASEVPESVRGPYDRALDGIRARPAR